MKSLRRLQLLVLIVASFFLMLLVPASPAHAEMTDILSHESPSQEWVFSEFKRIYNTYEVGDVLTIPDANFVKRYILIDEFYSKIEEGVPSFRTAGNVNEVDTQYGTRVSLKGNVWHTGTFNYNFGGKLTGSVISGPTPKQMKITVYCTAWGLQGSTLGLAYKDNVSHTVYDSRTIYMNKSKNYTGISAVHSINTSLDVTTASGAGFTVNAK